MNIKFKPLTASTIVAVALLAACGGGGGGSTPGGGGMPPINATTPPSGPTPLPTATATPTPTATPTAAPVITGKIVSIPAGAFGPNAPQTALAGATVILGPTLILGATPPPTLPAGDVQAITDASGNYSVLVAALQVAPDATTNALFVVPGLNLSGVTPPTKGYYISVFASGADGKVRTHPSRSCILSSFGEQISDPTSYNCNR